MMTTIRNSAYKIKAGSVNLASLADLKLEAGGIIVHDDRVFIIDSEGIHPVSLWDYLNLTGTAIVNALTDTPALLDYFDTIALDESVNLTPTIVSSSILVVADGKVIFTLRGTLESDLAGQEVTIRTLVDAVEWGNFKVIIPDAATPVDFEYSEQIDVVAAEVITFTGEILDTVATPDITVDAVGTFSSFH